MAVICDLCGDETRRWKKVPKEFRDENTNEICIGCNELLKVEIDNSDNLNKQNKGQRIRQYINQQKQSHGRGN